MPIKLIHPNVARYMESDPLKKIEYMARLCRGTEDKVNPDKINVPLIKFLTAKGHESVLEHYRINVMIPCNFKEFDVVHTCQNDTELFDEIILGENRHYHYEGILEQPIDVSDPSRGNRSFHVLAANIRFWRDCVRAFLDEAWVKKLFSISELISSEDRPRDRREDLAYSLYKWQPLLFEDLIPEHLLNKWKNSEEFLAEYYRFEFEEATDYLTVIVDTDRCVSHQWVRHREDFSFSQQSQRTVRQGNSVAYCLPIGFSWVDDNNTIFQLWKSDMDANSAKYIYLLDEMKLPPEEARNWLAGSAATRIGITATIDAWKRFLALRLPDDAYPPIRVLAREIKRKLYSHEVVRPEEESMTDAVTDNQEIRNSLARILSEGEENDRLTGQYTHVIDMSDKTPEEVFNWIGKDPIKDEITLNDLKNYLNTKCIQAAIQSNYPELSRQVVMSNDLQQIGEEIKKKIIAEKDPDTGTTDQTPKLLVFLPAVLTELVDNSEDTFLIPALEDEDGVHDYRFYMPCGMKVYLVRQKPIGDEEEDPRIVKLKEIAHR